MASMVASGNQDGPSVVLQGVDPETCMIVFKNHWAQVNSATLHTHNMTNVFNNKMNKEKGKSLKRGSLM